MKPQRIVAVAHKEWREVVRDRLFLVLAFVVPAGLMVVIGYGLSLDVDNIPCVVVDLDGSTLSRDYIYRLRSSPYFDWRGHVRDTRLVDDMIARGEIRAALVIPQHFEERLAAGRAAPMQILIDGTFPFRAQTIKGYLAGLVQEANLAGLTDYMAATRGITTAQAQSLIEPVRLETRYLYNSRLESNWSIAPKLIMMVLLISPPFLTALGIVREKERGSIYNIYASTVTRGEFLAGKLIPFVGISCVNAVVLWLLAVFLFGAPFKGSLLFFAPATLLYILCTSNIGLLISSFVRSQLAAMIIVLIATVPPSMLFSGMVVPIESLERGARVFAHLLPAMHYTRIVVGVFLKDVGPPVLLVPLVVLAAYACVLYTLAYWFFRKRPKA